MNLFDTVSKGFGKLVDNVSATQKTTGKQGFGNAFLRDMSFESHTRPNQSRLEKWRSEITEMRSKSWPYRRISLWLQAEHNLSISAQAIRAFCLRRGIMKASSSALPNSSTETSPRVLPTGQVPKKKPRFEYDDSEPIHLQPNNERPLP